MNTEEEMRKVFTDIHKVKNAFTFKDLMSITGVTNETPLITIVKNFSELTPQAVPVGGIPGVDKRIKAIFSAEQVDRFITLIIQNPPRRRSPDRQKQKTDTDFSTSAVLLELITEMKRMRSSLGVKLDVIGLALHKIALKQGHNISPDVAREFLDKSKDEG
jgi:hypothetical protein